MPNDPYHDRAVRILRGIVEGDWGQAFTSDYVLTEALNFVRARVHRHEVEEALLDIIMERPGARAPFAALVRVDEAVFSGALPLFERHVGRRLSFTDCTSLVLAEVLASSRIATFDRGFHGLVEVVDAT